VECLERRKNPQFHERTHDNLLINRTGYDCKLRDIGSETGVVTNIASRGIGEKPQWKGFKKALYRRRRQNVSEKGVRCDIVIAPKYRGPEKKNSQEKRMGWGKEKKGICESKKKKIENPGGGREGSKSGPGQKKTSRLLHLNFGCAERQSSLGNWGGRTKPT